MRVVQIVKDDLNRTYSIIGELIMFIENEVVVEDILFEDEEIQILKTSSEASKAILYRTVHPKVNVGSKVKVNETATNLRLGTGGVDIVTAVTESKSYKRDDPVGHIMKARYLPNQHSVLSVESQESEDHHLFTSPFSLGGKKVLIGELHSMIPICFWVMDKLKPSSSMVVIVNDDACLPLSYSNHIRALKKDSRFSTITIGQAFGGTYEAVNLQSALQFAHEKLNPEIILITTGPGVVGTGTTYGFSAMSQANWANVVGSLFGKPVWIPRLSEKDARSRHQGISHHTITPLLQFTYQRSIIPLPDVMSALKSKVKEQAEEINQQHQVEWIKFNGAELIEHCIKQSEVPVVTMGRSFEDDPLFFLGVAACMYWLLKEQS